MPRTAWIERIDEDHANPRGVWHTMGQPEGRVSPGKATPEQVLAAVKVELVLLRSRLAIPNRRQ